MKYMKYWKLLLLVPVVLLVVGCTSISFDISLEKVDLLNPTKTEYIQINHQGNQYIFNDDNIIIKWVLSNEIFAFDLTNKTSNTMEIVWDKSAYIDFDGKNHRVIHEGIKYIDKEQPQVNTIIVSNSSIQDQIFPSDYIRWISDKYGWDRGVMFLGTDMKWSGNTKDKVKILADSFINKNIKVLLTLKINDQLYEYLFIFKVNGYQFK